MKLILVRLRSMSRKFNTIQKFYKLENFPFGDGENDNLKSLKQAVQYWLDTSVRKANFIYNMLDSPTLSQLILHDKHTINAVCIHEKMHNFFQNKHLAVWSLLIITTCAPYCKLCTN